MKRRYAKEILADSFLELAAGTEIDKITVQDITQNCGYSHATFYRHFKDKYDLIAWDYARKMADLMDRTRRSGDPWRQTLLQGARHCLEQKDYLINLFLHTSGLDSFYFHMSETHCRLLADAVKAAAGVDAVSQAMEMSIRLYCYGAVALACEWLMGRYPAGAEEFAEVVDRSLPPALRPFVSAE